MDIKQLIEELKIVLNESPKLNKVETNLPVLIYVSQHQGSHGPRIKFMNRKDDKWVKENEISICISDNPKIVAPKDLNKIRLVISNKELEKLYMWIIQNKKVLLDFWNEIIKDEKELKPLLTPFGK